MLLQMEIEQINRKIRKLENIIARIKRQELETCAYFGLTPDYTAFGRPQFNKYEMAVVTAQLGRQKGNLRAELFEDYCVKQESRKAQPVNIVGLLDLDDEY